MRATATKLGLPRPTQSPAEYVGRADAGQMAYLDFLDLVLEEELAVREERRFRHALRVSRLPHYKRPAAAPRTGPPRTLCRGEQDQQARERWEGHGPDRHRRSALHPQHS
ncbi:ATP-binding protein [Streptomyces sp. NPDC057557]|uniref:ATP-binding protein n=1 Tax=Streptomyces sp. NPDC057557 TaxID=3346167 RepID=UPI00367FAA0B